MPFATVERTHKRIRSGDEFMGCYSPESDLRFCQQPPYEPSHLEWPAYQPLHGYSSKQQAATHTPHAASRSYPTQGYWAEHKSSAPVNIPFSSRSPSPFASSFLSPPLGLFSRQAQSYSSDSSAEDVSPTVHSSDGTENTFDDGSHGSLFNLAPPSPAPSPPGVPHIPGSTSFNNMLSKFSLSHTSFGIKMEAKVTNISDLRSLIEVFGKLSSAPSPTENEEPAVKATKEKTSSIVLYRNRHSRTRPVNFFASVDLIGQLLYPPSMYEPSPSLRFIADACIETYFSCWIRCTQVINKDEFMSWYGNHKDPTETLIVNAICAYVFRHVVTHHQRPEFAPFLEDQDKIQQLEDIFFNRARDCLAQSFDRPDRLTILALLCMCCRAEPTRRHHYLGMATSALHELEIYPRMRGDDNDSFEKELDTRLWWFVWAIDFYVYSCGAPKNTPQSRFHGVVDLPRIFEQDIDGAEIGVLTYVHCLMLWRIQADIIQTLYEQDSDMMGEQREGFDRQLTAYYEALPPYFRFESGFEYGCEDLFLACVRVNIEYNATRIILHKLFIPEVSDPHPSRFSLESLNICLATALNQLRTLNTCTKNAIGHCVFDRDELWRAAEVISISKDIQRTCSSSIVLDNIDIEDYERGLHRAYDILKETREHGTKRKDWIQVEDWLQAEIRRHQLYAYPSQQPATPTVTKAPNYFLANLKPRDEPVKKERKPKGTDTMVSVLSFSQTETAPPLSRPGKTSTCHNNTKTENSIPSFFHFSPAEQGQTTPTSGQRGQARFRYFNPSNMNKFLFIDENPTTMF